MSRDPIVEEVWRLRAEAWEAFGDDLDRYFEHLEAESKQHPERLIDPEELARHCDHPPVSDSVVPADRRAS